MYGALGSWGGDELSRWGWKEAACLLLCSLKLAALADKSLILSIFLQSTPSAPVVSIPSDCWRRSSAAQTRQNSHKSFISITIALSSVLISSVSTGVLVAKKKQPLVMLAGSDGRSILSGGGSAEWTQMQDNTSGAQKGLIVQNNHRASLCVTNKESLDRVQNKEDYEPCGRTGVTGDITRNMT